MQWAGPIKVKPFFIAMTVLLLISAPLYLLEWFYPFFLEWNGLSFLLFALANIGEAITLMISTIKIDKVPPHRIATALARYELIVNPIATFSVLSISAIFPMAPRNWLYYLNIGVTVALILARGAAILWLQKQIRQGNTGYLPYRNHAYILMSLSFIVLNYYVISIWKSANIDIQLIYEGGFEWVNDFFLLMTVIEVLIGVLLLVQSMFFMLCNYYSGKEDKAVDLRLNFKQSKRLLMKYDINFWIGIFALFIMLSLAAMSMSASIEAYAPITFLYAMVLVSRLLAYFGVTRIRKKGKGNLLKIFKREHALLLYIAIFFAAYSILCIAFGRMAFERMGNVDYTMFVTFGVFIPWAIFKLVIGALHYQKARKKGDDTALMNAYIDILLSIYTLSQTFAIVAVKAHMEGFRIAAIVLASLLSLYCLYVSIRMAVIGVLGLRGKRDKQLSLLQQEEQE